MTRIDTEKPFDDQLQQIGDQKRLKTAASYLTEKTMLFLPILTYAYELEYKERPDYNKMKFLFRKILMDRGYFPAKEFQWALKAD